MKEQNLKFNKKTIILCQYEIKDFFKHFIFYYYLYIYIYMLL